MLRILGPPRRLCDRASRRTFLHVGALGGLGCLLPGLTAGARSADSESAGSASQLPAFGRARRCLLLFLTGGPPQHDTWDPKPAAPAQIRGEFSPIATSAEGIQFGELFPKLAVCADRLRVVRSLSHADTVHTTAGYALLTGVTHPRANQVASATLIK